MSESVSGVDAILAGLRKTRTWVNPGRPPLVYFEDAEAAVHATAQKYEAALARQGAMLDRCRDERLSWEDVEQHAEAAVHATVREIETALRRQSEEAAGSFGTYASGMSDAADLVARRFGGTT